MKRIHFSLILICIFIFSLSPIYSFAQTSDELYNTLVQSICKSLSNMPCNESNKLYIDSLGGIDNAQHFIHVCTTRNKCDVICRHQCNIIKCGGGDEHEVNDCFASCSHSLCSLYKKTSMGKREEEQAKQYAEEIKRRATIAETERQQKLSQLEIRLALRTGVEQLLNLNVQLYYSTYEPNTPADRQFPILPPFYVNDRLLYKAQKSIWGMVEALAYGPNPQKPVTHSCVCNCLENSDRLDTYVAYMNNGQYVAISKDVEKNCTERKNDPYITACLQICELPNISKPYKYKNKLYHHNDLPKDHWIEPGSFDD